MKMETPKMDVVRFQEADVLAASPITPVTPVFLTGFNDVTAKNGQLSFTKNGTDYLFETSKYDSQESFANAVAGAGVADVTFNDNSDPDSHSLAGMFYADVEQGGKSLLLPDGQYVWNPNKGTYSYQ